jgi:osmotically-inducible protein OsmY
MQANKTDSEIQQDVLRELRWDTRVDDTDVGVEVDRGVVTLTGTVENWAKKLAAQEAAHRVAGVRDVADDVRIKTPGIGKPNDTEIAQAVRHALAWDVFVPHEAIQSTVTDGGVTLTGVVDHYSQRTSAETALKNLAGVRWVVNRIEVRRQDVSPVAVRKAIEDALERRAERAAKEVQLEVRDGEVILTGRARSWAERTAIVEAAAAAPGVVGIQDRIRIEP